ncbi:MAG: right-handed parallel beta-helix repeat-containing protein [Candidatus Marinimicrobia bacterium]|nr:right-handed parallel beta-helix repeat-containing protein [Candidatus Neomarinimicrobiota bacterium]
MKRLVIIIFFLIFGGSLLAQPAFDIPGFFNEDGSVHEILDPLLPWGDTVNVLDYGVDILDNDFDDRPGIQAAVSAAGAGDLVYFPNGVYNLLSSHTSSSTSHIMLSDGYHLHGESMEGTILKSQFPLTINQNETTKTVKLQGLYAVTINSLTFSSDYSGAYSTNPTINNPDRSAPGVHLYIDDSGSTPSRRVVVDSCRFEKFRAAAIRLANSSDCIVRNSDFRMATDVGGGGSGYGITVQGNGHNVDSYGLARDSRYNLIEDNSFTGPYIRHGVVVQYYSHNNLIRNNILTDNVLDALDLHGEDEYNNEICYNEIRDVTSGGGVGVGNTGALHDASGYYNYIHHNVFINCREGVRVYLGSPHTRIEHNRVENCTVSSGKGFYIQNAPHTILKNNIIRYNNSSGFAGIYLKYDPGTLGGYAGNPEFVWIDSNQIYYNTNGVIIENGTSIYYGPDNLVYSNTDYDTLFGVNVTWWEPVEIVPVVLAGQPFVISSYPNPYNTSFVLNLNGLSRSETSIVIIDICGRRLKMLFQGVLEAGNHRLTVQTPELASGIYFIHCRQSLESRTHKVVLNR